MAPTTTPLITEDAASGLMALGRHGDPGTPGRSVPVAATMHRSRPLGRLLVNGISTCLQRLPTPMLVTVLAVVALTACDDNGDDTAAPSASPSASPSPSSSATRLPTPTVTMTIADHARLTRAVPWQVTISAADATVREVDFLIDGRQTWVEQEPPYSFDDDGQLLTPWLLGNGRHILTARAVMGTGATADATAHVVVGTHVAGNTEVAGTYRRTVTRSDQQRAEPYRVPSKGAFGNESPTGTWTIHIRPNGEIVGVDPAGDTANPFIEPFTLSGSTMRLYGPALWRQPDPDFAQPLLRAREAEQLHLVLDRHFNHHHEHPEGVRRPGHRSGRHLDPFVKPSPARFHAGA